MKRYVSIIALLLTAALLTACGSGADTQSKEADAAVQTALPPEGITALVLSDDSQVLRFSREDETWYWQDDTTFPLDQEAMPAASPVRVAEEDLADYGLDDTKITLAVTADGETLTFARGDQAESGDWYMRCAEDGTVRLVSDNAVKIFQLLDGSIYGAAGAAGHYRGEPAVRRGTGRGERPGQHPRGGRRAQGGQPRCHGGHRRTGGGAGPVICHCLCGL